MKKIIIIIIIIIIIKDGDNYMKSFAICILHLWVKILKLRMRWIGYEKLKLHTKF
jgi:hypothetical protein